jgi:hypothetical protein
MSGFLGLTLRYIYLTHKARPLIGRLDGGRTKGFLWPPCTAWRSYVSVLGGRGRVFHE